MLTQSEFIALKSALTRAKKKGPRAVIETCDRAFAIFQEKGYPDNWHNWNIAKQDAELQIRRRDW